MAKQSSIRPWLILATILTIFAFVLTLIGGEDFGTALIMSIVIGIAGTLVIAFFAAIITGIGK